MAETLSQQSPNQEIANRNAELLAHGELGPLLQQAYATALELKPELDQVEVIALGDDGPSQGSAVPAWRSASGRHEAHVRLDGANATDRIHDLYKVPGARQLWADKLGIAEQDMTVELGSVFSAIHELGHAAEFTEHEADPEAFNTRRKKEWLALPAGVVATSKLMDATTVEHASALAELASPGNKFGVGTIEEVYEAQHNAYRDMTDESYADNFAATVLKANPDIITALSATQVHNYQPRPASNDVLSLMNF